MVKEEITIGGLILLFIGVIVVLAIIPTIADETSTLIDKRSIVNETIDITTARQAGLQDINESIIFNVTHENADRWKQLNCPLTNFVMRNQTNGTLVEGTDYVVTLEYGNFSLLSSVDLNTSVDNDTYIDYTYCPDGYITDGSGRTVANLILIFASLALIAFAIYYSVRKWF